MSLVEAVVALALSLLIVVGLWSAASSARRQAAWLDQTASRTDAARVVGLLLDLDADGLRGGGRPGEVSVRGFRWWGLPCASPLRSGASMSWRGSRRPDPSKDSVWLVSPSGRIEVRRVTRVTRGLDCGDPGALHVEWQPDVDEAPVLLRGFERGAYRLDDAFRYRRGAGGAQPLTDAVFAPDSVGIQVGAGRVFVRAGWAARRTWRIR